MMSFMGSFGFGAETIKAQGHCVSGTVQDVSECWWMKVNTKPVRASSKDGAVFPHMIFFTYEVDGAQYTGRWFVNWNRTCPCKGAAIRVYYDQKQPGKYAVEL